MSKPQTGAMSAKESADLDNLLADLELNGNDETVEEVIEEAEAALAGETVIDELDIAEEDLLAAESAIEREEAYESQSSEVDADAEAPAQAQANKPAKGKKTKSASSGGAPKTSTPRVARDLSTVAAEHFVIEGDASTMSADDLEAAKKATMALQPGQKKIAEKFENLFSSLAAGKAPSRYVVDAFKLLEAKKSMSSADLVAGFMTAGLGEGTARSQTGQIMHLFEVVKIAKRTKQTLDLIDDSVVAGKLRALIS